MQNERKNDEEHKLLKTFGRTCTNKLQNLQTINTTAM